MRTLLVISLLVPLAAAGRDDDKRILELVPLLGSDDPGLRADAARRLVALGEDSIPALQELSSSDPEINRALRALIRRGLTLKLLVAAPTQPHNLGEALTLQVSIINNTEETCIVPLAQRSNRGTGTMSSFLVQVMGQEPVRLRPDQVELIEPQDRQLMLKPEAVLRVVITFNGLDSPLHQPGETVLSILYHGLLANLRLSHGRNAVQQLTPLSGTVLKSRRFSVLALGRKAAEFDRDLDSSNLKTSRLALAELNVREDDAILAVLRRHARDARLRLRAIRVLGKAHLPQDLELIRVASSGRSEPIAVRLAATEALGLYRDRKARVRLVALAQSARLREAAVEALTRHKDALAIDCFVRLLQRNFHEGPWSRRALAAILAWTDKHVENRRGEIDAFERWWQKNRQRWISANK